MNLAEGLITALIGARMAAGMAALRLKPGPDAGERLTDFPAGRAPVAQPVSIRWNQYAIPFIEAASDGDCAFALGMVHAHLRLAQIEVMRRVALGRVAEMLGPAAVPVDHGLRLIGFARAVPRIVAALPAATRAWTDSFAAGISHYAATARRLPPEFALLGLRPERWSAADVIAVGRLASADVNWVLLLNLLKLRGRPDWPNLWRGIAGHDGASIVPLVEDAPPLARIATMASRTGSNALAVSGRRSASGAGLMAADPHLSVALPNFWLAAGIRCPSIHAAGLMIPGLPFVAIGRNPVAAWSGTCLQSASTELFDATGLKPDSRRARVRVRGGKPVEIALRHTPLGPLVSDSPLAAKGGAVAMTWMGHRPSDEMSAWLGVNRARSWRQFAAATAAMAVPGQTLVYADRAGHVGKLMAAHLPARPEQPPADILLPPSEAAAWKHVVTGALLPAVIDPDSGIVASANDRPSGGGTRVGLFFCGPERCRRLHQLTGSGQWDLDGLAALQHDVHSHAAIDFKDWLAQRLADHPIATALTDWDGSYDARSTGATAFEHLLERLYRLVHGDDGMAAYWASWDPQALLRRLLEDIPAQDMAQAATGLPPPVPWGDVHRLRLVHLLGMLPGMARLCRFADLPASGGNDTLMKTAHGIATADGPHGVRFGANARFLADLSHDDASRIVLLGGQDGWPGAECFLDQLPLWRTGQYIPLPLHPGPDFRHRTDLEP